MPCLTVAGVVRPMPWREWSGLFRITGAAGLGAGSLAWPVTIGVEAAGGVAAALGSVAGRCALQREREEESSRAVVVPPGERDGKAGATAGAAGAGVSTPPLPVG